MIATRAYPRLEITRLRPVKPKPAPHQSPFGRDTIGHAMPANPTRTQLERLEVKAHREGACRAECSVCAVDRLAAARPLKPPPGRIARVEASAAALALAADRRAGLVGEWGW